MENIRDQGGNSVNTSPERLFQGYRLEDSTHSNALTFKSPIVGPESFYKYFPAATVISPDRVCRPKGDTTFFTTAGIQHLETMLSQDDNIPTGSFTIAQPVIRSQFMSRVRLGTSTSFINFSVGLINASPSEYRDTCHAFIQLVVDQDIEINRLRYTTQEEQDKWGERTFRKSIWTLYLDDTELGECVYLWNYPVKEGEQVPIVDLGLGVERLIWAIGRNEYYFPDSAHFFGPYETHLRDNIASVVDSIRSMVLIAGDGIVPSLHDHGYKLRQFSKRFVSGNTKLRLPTDEVVTYAYETWNRWGYIFDKPKEVVYKVINTENERNFNSLFLDFLRDHHGINVKLNINQSTEDFMHQLEFSLPKAVIAEAQERINEQ